MQLDEGHRGFAYSYPAPLDMRMDQTAGMTAQDVLMNYSKDELIRILRQYGEERFAPRIALFQPLLAELVEIPQNAHSKLYVSKLIKNSMYLIARFLLHSHTPLLAVALSLWLTSHWKTKLLRGTSQMYVLQRLRAICLSNFQKAPQNFHLSSMAVKRQRKLRLQKIPARRVFVFAQ